MIDEPKPEAYTRGPFRGLTPNVIRMGLVSFFADVSGEMLYPLIPLFLTLVVGATPAVLGVIEGAAEATASLLKSVSGRWSDQTGRRKPFVLAGYSLSAFAKPLIALAGPWGVVLAARVFDRLGKGLRASPRDALLAESVTPEARGRAFGWHRAMDSAGAVLGPLIALPFVLVAAQDPNKLRLVFLAAFVPGILGALLVLLVREQPRAPRADAAPRADWRALSPNFRAYLLAWGAFALANSSDTFLLLRAQTVFAARGAGNAVALTLLAYVLYNAVYAAASPYLGHLSDRLGRKAVLIGGLIVFAAVYLGFAVDGPPWLLWPLFAVYGLYTAATDGVGKALAVDLAPAEMRAGALGLLGTVSGLAALLASLVAGVLWSRFGAPVPFLYGAVGAVLGAVLLLRVRKDAQPAAV
jgi:MFS family permease